MRADRCCHVACSRPTQDAEKRDRDPTNNRMRIAMLGGPTHTLQPRQWPTPRDPRPGAAREVVLRAIGASVAGGGGGSSLIPRLVWLEPPGGISSGTREGMANHRGAGVRKGVRGRARTRAQLVQLSMSPRAARPYLFVAQDTHRGDVVTCARVSAHRRLGDAHKRVVSELRLDCRRHGAASLCARLLRP